MGLVHRTHHDAIWNPWWPSPRASPTPGRPGSSGARKNSRRVRLVPEVPEAEAVDQVLSKSLHSPRIYFNAASTPSAIDQKCRCMFCLKAPTERPSRLLWATRTRSGLRVFSTFASSVSAWLGMCIWEKRTASWPMVILRIFASVTTRARPGALRKVRLRFLRCRIMYLRAKPSKTTHASSKPSSACPRRQLSQEELSSRLTWFE